MRYVLSGGLKRKKVICAYIIFVINIDFGVILPLKLIDIIST